MRRNHRIEEYYKSLIYKKVSYSRGYSKKTILDQLKENVIPGEDKDKNRLTILPAVVGNKYKYNNSNSIMVVGRAVNGWEHSYNCTSVETVVESMFNESFNPLNDVIDDLKEKYNKNYSYARSRFWKLIKAVLDELGVTDACSNFRNDYKCREWPQTLIWSNIYKVAPYKSSNPSGTLISDIQDECLTILKAEIEEYKPKNVIFITGEYTWESNINHMSLSEALGIKLNKNTNDNVIGTGCFKESNIIVVNRPESYSNETIRKVAKKIKNKMSL